MNKALHPKINVDKLYAKRKKWVEVSSTLRNIYEIFTTFFCKYPPYFKVQFGYCIFNSEEEKKNSLYLPKSGVH